MHEDKLYLTKCLLSGSSHFTAQLTFHLNSTSEAMWLYFNFKTCALINFVLVHSIVWWDFFKNVFCTFSHCAPVCGLLDKLIKIKFILKVQWSINICLWNQLVTGSILQVPGNVKFIFFYLHACRYTKSKYLVWRIIVLKWKKEMLTNRPVSTVKTDRLFFYFAIERGICLVDWSTTKHLQRQRLPSFTVVVGFQSSFLNVCWHLWTCYGSACWHNNTLTYLF